MYSIPEVIRKLKLWLNINFKINSLFYLYKIECNIRYSKAYMDYMNIFLNNLIKKKLNVLVLNFNF